MASLDDLLKIDGVAAAVEFAADGKLVEYKANMDMSQEMAAMSAEFCATVTMLFNTLAHLFIISGSSSYKKHRFIRLQGKFLGETTLTAAGTTGYQGNYMPYLLSSYPW